MKTEEIQFYKNHCRVCKKDVDETDSTYPFCSEECHLVWAAENMPKNTETGKEILTIEQIQTRLKQMAKGL